MTAIASAIRPEPLGRRLLRRHGWTAAVYVLLAVLLAWYATLIPRFGAFEIATIAKGGLPLALLALAQGVIIISGGVDLSVGAIMVLTNATAAQLMEGRASATTILVAVGVVAAAALVDAGVGWVIHTSRVPDIVVTLATSFIFLGVALLILPSPGGGTSAVFRYVFTGSDVGIGTNPWPSVAVIVVVTAVAAVVLRRTTTGLRLYAVGSNPQAAFLAGMDLRRAKISAYAIGGALAAFAGLAATAITGAGEARASIGDLATLNSVAAVVLGGIVLGGGRGSLLGAAAAGYVLYLLSPILTSLGVDPNTGEVVKGVLLIAVVMGAALIQTRRSDA